MKGGIRWMVGGIIAGGILWPEWARAADAAQALLEQLDLTELQSLSDEAGVSASIYEQIKAIIEGNSTWDWPAIGAQLRQAFQSAFTGILPALMVALTPVFLFAAVRRLFPMETSSALTCVNFVGYVFCASRLMRLFQAQYEGVRAAIGWIAALSERIAPLLVSLVTLSGGVRGAAVITPMAAFAGDLMTHILQSVALRLAVLAAIVTVAGYLHAQIRISRLYRFLRSGANWMMGAVMSGYLALMSVRTLLGDAYDGVTVRTAKYAADHLIPVVGGDVAEAMDVLIGSVRLVKNATGVVCLTVLLSALLQPLMRIAAAVLGCRLAAALSEPVADDRQLMMIDGFSGALTILLVSLVTAATIVVIMVGTTAGWVRTLG